MLVEQLAETLRNGVPRIAELARPAAASTKKKRVLSGSATLDGTLGAEAASAKVALGSSDAQELEQGFNTEYSIYAEIMVNDVLKIMGRIRKLADIPCIHLFLDEFLSLSEPQQRRFSTLLKTIMGTHEGVFVKLCGIRDNYVLGSTIILQRDLFELSLDLDAYVERSESLNSAMKGLNKLTEQIVTRRLKAYGTSPSAILASPGAMWPELSRSAMGVPRTLGIVLKNAWGRARAQDRHRMQRSDIDYGIRAASKAYMNQLLGASRDGIGIPRFVGDTWGELVRQATLEKSRSSGDASHFMILVEKQDRLKWLTMFFLIHLLTDGRTTKKERFNRSLYCFDYGVCLENNLGFAEDKNVIRQQRFAYDDLLNRYDKFFETKQERHYFCRNCNVVYPESDLFVASRRLAWCPHCRSELEEHAEESGRTYTEEEIKIVGAIRSAEYEDRLLARDVADNVGCYVQKVAKFGQKLEKDGFIKTRKREDLNRLIYYKHD